MNNQKFQNIENKIINSISKLTNLNKDQINLKGKTVEKLGLIGKEKAIACEVIISITKMIKNLNTLFVTMFGLGKIKKNSWYFWIICNNNYTLFFFHIFKHIFKYNINKFNNYFYLFFFAVANHIKNNENKDPKEVVIDEFIGQSIPIYLI